MTHGKYLLQSGISTIKPLCPARMCENRRGLDAAVNVHTDIKNRRGGPLDDWFLMVLPARPGM